MEQILGVNPCVTAEIIDIAKKYSIQKVLVFGSRARGDYKERSDIDLAVSGGNIVNFMLDIEEVKTLLLFDVVNLDAPVQEELREAIEREGRVIYEKI